MPVTPAEPIGMSTPLTVWGVGGWVWGVGAGGVSEPRFVDRPKFDNGTVFGSLFTTGFGGSATGSAIATFFGAGGATGFSTTPDTRFSTAGIGANLIFSVE